MSSTEESKAGSGAEPGMIHGHAAYVAAAAKETLGSYTSTPLQEAGAHDKSAALDEMRAAKAQSSGEVGKNETLGKVEKSLGSVTGCEGMEEEGGKRMGS